MQYGPWSCPVLWKMSPLYELAVLMVAIEASISMLGVGCGERNRDSAISCH